MAHILLVYLGMMNTDAFARMSVGPIAASTTPSPQLARALQRICGLGIGLVLSFILTLLV